MVNEMVTYYWRYFMKITIISLFLILLGGMNLTICAAHRFEGLKEELVIKHERTHTVDDDSLENERGVFHPIPVLVAPSIEKIPIRTYSLGKGLALISLVVSCSALGYLLARAIIVA
jgi:hypothetical protein